MAERGATWRVRYWRLDSPHQPVSQYHRGDKAEAEARSRAEDLRQRDGILNVEVDRIERTRRDN